MADYITTYTGIHMIPSEPKAEDFQIDDIAHALPLICRGNGHVKTFWSVGQHCIACAKEAAARQLPDRIVLACLLHDAGECYLSDVPRPVKKEMPDYQSMEKTLLSVIYRKFLGSDLTEAESRAVKEIDDALLWYDLENLLGELQLGKIPEIHIGLSYEVRPFTDVEEEYLELYYQYSGEEMPKTVCIEELADEFEAMFDGWSQFLNKKTCEIISLPDADNDYADREDEDEELYDEIAFSDDYVRLPDKYELREKNVMYDFAESVGGNKSDRLFSALHGRHPYRYFKDTADRLDLLQEYYDFRFASYCSFAEEWCKENGLKYHHKKRGGKTR